MELDLAGMHQLAAGQGIDPETLDAALSEALRLAYLKTPHAAKHARVELDPRAGSFTVWAQDEIPGEPTEDDPHPAPTLGEEYDDTPHDFGRLAAATARQVISQLFRKAEDDKVFGAFSGQKGKLITGIVQQDVYLFSGTVAQNIAYGKPDATDEEIIAAAKAAHADSFIRRLPNGYDTVIAEDGGNISQGQKQLLCIARVMLCLPPMLILDEATSSIDTRTEVRIQAAFARMMQGRTSFIVAHRLSTIREADVILVMKDGRIVEQGDHDELLAQGGFYAKLYNSQFEGVET